MPLVFRLLCLCLCCWFETSHVTLSFACIAVLSCWNWLWLTRSSLYFCFAFFLLIPCGRLSWIPVSFLLHVKYTLPYRIVSYRLVQLQSSCVILTTTNNWTSAWNIAVSTFRWRTISVRNLRFAHHYSPVAFVRVPSLITSLASSLPTRRDDDRPLSCVECRWLAGHAASSSVCFRRWFFETPACNSYCVMSDDNDEIWRRDGYTTYCSSRYLLWPVSNTGQRWPSRTWVERLKYEPNQTCRRSTSTCTVYRAVENNKWNPSRKNVDNSVASKGSCEIIAMVLERCSERLWKRF